MTGHHAHHLKKMGDSLELTTIITVDITDARVITYMIVRYLRGISKP